MSPRLREVPKGNGVVIFGGVNGPKGLDKRMKTIRDPMVAESQ